MHYTEPSIKYFIGHKKALSEFSSLHILFARQAWDLSDGLMKQIQPRSMCNLIIQRDNPDGSKMAIGCIESLNSTEMVKPYSYDVESELGNGWALVRVKAFFHS
jgi:hypothetical protein